MNRIEVLRVLFILSIFDLVLFSSAGVFDMMYYGRLRMKTLILIVSCYTTPFIFSIVLKFRSWFE